MPRSKTPTRELNNKVKMVPRNNNDKKKNKIHSSSSHYRLTLGLYIRGIGIIYFISFSHLIFQVIGLVGSKGISPIPLFLKRTEDILGHNNYAKYFYYPTIFWFNSNDDSIIGSCILGSFISLMLVFGIFGTYTTKLNLFFCYVIKLSLCVVGGDLFAFPWDYLLMEATILCLFLPPLKPLFGICNSNNNNNNNNNTSNNQKNENKNTGGILLIMKKKMNIDYGLTNEPSSSLHRLAHFSLIFLCVRFMLAMGLEKVPFLNDCPEWWNLTYLKFFYEREQPMPTALAWTAFHFPMSFHHFSAWSTWIIELFVPFMCFYPNIYCKRFASILLMFFQFPIMITGNYSILNWLTIVLCIPALDDGIMLFSTTNNDDDDEMAIINTKKSVLSDDKKDNERRKKECGIKTLYSKTSGPILKLFLYFHCLIGTMYTLRIVESGGISYLANPNWIFDRRYDHSLANNMMIMPKDVLLWLQRYHIIQQYGGVFFSTFDHDGKMVNIIQGSHDGENWFEYDYKYHVQDVNEPPQFFAPLFPRLDHFIFYETNQIAFNNINPMSPLFARNPSGSTFLQLIQRLLENEPTVLQLFRKNKHVTSKKPLYIRVLVYNYRFTSSTDDDDDDDDDDDNKHESSYWTRKPVFEILPPVTLGDAQLSNNNFYSICHYMMLSNGGMPEDIGNVCTNDEDSNSIKYVYNFEQPSSIYKRSKTLYLLSSVMGLPPSYIESLRDMLHWNEDKKKSLDFEIFNSIVNMKDGCIEYIYDNIRTLRGGKLLAQKLLTKGLNPYDTKWLLLQLNNGNNKEAMDGAIQLLSLADNEPTLDGNVTMEEIADNTEVTFALCKEYYFQIFEL